MFSYDFSTLMIHIPFSLRLASRDLRFFNAFMLKKVSSSHGSLQNTTIAQQRIQCGWDRDCIKRKKCVSLTHNHQQCKYEEDVPKQLDSAKPEGPLYEKAQIAIAREERASKNSFSQNAFTQKSFSSGIFCYIDGSSWPEQTKTLQQIHHCQNFVLKTAQRYRRTDKFCVQ